MSRSSSPTPNDGGPAFPEIRTGYDDGSHEYTGNVYSTGGMTMRDYFAAKALQGMLAYPGDAASGSHHNNNTLDGVAEMAYGYADALLKARGA